MRLISKSIKLLEAPQFQYPYCHCLLIEDECTCLLDSSPFESEKEYLAVRKPNLILNTHGHQDHCLINADHPWAKVCMHIDEHPIVASGEAYLHELGFYHYTSEVVRTHFLAAVGFRTRPADEAIENGSKIDLGKNTIETVHLPGHSAGHCGFILRELGLIFTGDIDLSKFPWYANVRSSVRDFLSSIQLLVDMKPDGIITGHGEGLVTKNLTAKLEKYRDIILLREMEIIRLLASGKNTVEDIASHNPVYKKLPKPEALFYMNECMMVLKHLEHLMEIDKVFFDSGKYYLKDGIKVKGTHLI